MSDAAGFVFRVVNKLSVVVLLVAGLSGLVRFRQLTINLRYLVGLIWFELSIELVAQLLWQRQLPNLFLGPVDSAGEFLLLSLVYGRALRSAAFTRARPWLAGSLVLYAGLTSLLSPEMARFKPFLQVVESLLVLMLVTLYFRKLLNELRVEKLSREPMVWVSSGLLIYCLGNVQIALFSNYLMRYSKQLNMTVWTIHALILVVLYGCYCLALWIRPQK